MLDAIKERRSIRRFKTTPLSEQQIDLLLKAAQSAPSGCNVQPWRFIIIRDGKLKSELRKVAYNQEFIESAPVVFVCCGELLSWRDTKERNAEILKKGDVQLTPECESALMNRVNRAASVEMHKRIPSTLLNVAIAIEHIVLEAVELGLGSCWVRLFDEKKVKKLLHLPENLIVVALLPVGAPDENPEPRPRLPLSTIVLPIKSP